MSKIREIIKEQISDCDICDNRKECKECWVLNKAEAEIKKLVERIVPKSKPQFLSNKHFEYGNGWCDGRIQLRKEIQKRVKEVFGD